MWLLIAVTACLAGPLTAGFLDDYSNVDVGHYDGGLHFRMPHSPGVKEVFFNYMLKKLMEDSPRVGRASRGNDGYWYHRAPEMRLQPYDEIKFSVSALSILGKMNGPMTSWVNDPATSKPPCDGAATATPEPHMMTTPTPQPRTQSPSMSTSKPGTTTAPQPAPAGSVVFRDDFSGSTLDLNHWKYEVSMYGGMNWEFQVYTNQESNVYLKDGNLHLKPTLTVDDPKFDENFLHTGTMDVAAIWGDCTNNAHWGCSRDGVSGLLPPTMSGKITTRHSMKYGTVEVRAKIPQGDWIWPAIWMLPKDNKYGEWPRSGEIDIMESRGNIKAVAPDGVNHGTNEIGSTLHWGPEFALNRYPLTHEEKFMKDGTWHDDFHTWRLTWTADHLITTVDGEEIMRVTPPSGGFWELGNLSDTGSNIWQSGEKMAPFDQEFYLILNVAVGGVSGFFPDDFVYNHTKPWLQTSQQAALDFWNKRNDWSPSWKGDSSAMIIDYIEMRRL